MTIKELMRILKQVPNAQMPIIQGRNSPEIYVSISRKAAIPEGWSQACSVPGYYPADTIRIRYMGVTL